MSAIEIETFVLRRDLSDESFTVLDEQLTEWSYLNRPGLVRRTTARSADHAWLIETWWNCAADAEAECAGEVVDRWRESVDSATYERKIFLTLD